MNKGFPPFEVLINLAWLGVHANGSNQKITHGLTQQLKLRIEQIG